MIDSLDEHTRIRVARLIARRTQRAVALEVGIAPAVLSDFELGYRSLPPEVVLRLRRALAERSPNGSPEAA